jgi:hypothetical protein
MPKLSRWLVAQKRVEIFDRDTRQRLLALGAHIGGGWNAVHQHVCVTPENKEAIIAMLTQKGFETFPCEDVQHPESLHQHS